jgi:hypothetical protein
MPVTLEDWKAITTSAFSNSTQQALLVQETRRECARKLLQWLASQERRLSSTTVLTLLVSRLRLIDKEQGH